MLSRIKNLFRSTPPQEVPEAAAPVAVEEPQVATASSGEKKLYPFQRAAVDAVAKSPKGKVILPTGSGKSFIAAEAVADAVQEGFERGDVGQIYVIVVPRLLLGRQLSSDFGASIANRIGSFHRFEFNSDKGSRVRADDTIRRSARRAGEDTTYRPSEVSTLGQTLVEFVKARSQDRVPTVIMTTYHSWFRAAKALAKADQEITMIVFDEAHNLVSERHRDENRHHLEELVAQRQYFFTATPANLDVVKGTDLGYVNFGMDSKELYGEVLYTLTDVEAVELGLITPIRLHGLRLQNDEDAADMMTHPHKSIRSSFEQHATALKESPGDLAASLLVSCDGLKEIRSFMESEDAAALQESGVAVCAVGSKGELDNGVINGEEQQNRPAWLEKVRALLDAPDQQVLVLHDSILAEGIDASGFTGVLPLKSLKLIAFCQTIGRARRLDPRDRDRFRSGDLDPKDPGRIDEMHKPFAWLLIPSYTIDFKTNREKFLQWVENILRCGVTPEELVEASRQAVNEQEDEIPGMPEIASGLFATKDVPLESQIESIARANAYGHLSPARQLDDMVDYCRDPKKPN